MTDALGRGMTKQNMGDGTCLAGLGAPELFGAFAAGHDDYVVLADAWRALEHLDPAQRRRVLDAFRVVGRLAGPGDGLAECMGGCAVVMDQARRANTPHCP